MSNLSTISLQDIADIAQSFPDLEPLQNVGGLSLGPALSAANDTMNAICATSFPHKWNEVGVPVFYTNSFQQDYAAIYAPGLLSDGALTIASVVAATTNGRAIYTGTITGGDFNAYVGIPFLVVGFVTHVGNNGTFMCVASTSTTLTLKNTAALAEAQAATATSAGSSVLNMSWLERGVAFDINNSSIPKPYVDVECGRQLPQRNASYVSGGGMGNPGFLVNWFPNRNLYYGVWGQANVGSSTIGNNPVAGSVYTNPLNQPSQPANPITMIQDANGNFLLLTTYGTEGSTAPLAAKNATPGTIATGVGATTAWTVLDPNGWGFRILPVPSQNGVVWEFNLVAQMKPVRFVSLSQTLDPLPDEFESHFRQGFIAQCYRYSPEAKVRAKFQTEWALWKQSLNELRAKEDRELEENRFVPDRTVMGAARRRNTYVGGAWPFNYPRP